jgi:hypothetical protein
MKITPKKYSISVLSLSILITAVGNTSYASPVIGRSPASLWDDLKGLFKQVSEINPSLEPSPLPSSSSQPSQTPIKSAGTLDTAPPKISAQPVVSSKPAVSVKPTLPLAPPPSAPAARANACSPIGPQRIGVILASYPGAPSDSAIPDADYVRSLFDNTDQGFSISDYYKTISGGKTWFSSVKVVGPYQSTPFISKNDTPGNYYRSLEAWEAHLLHLAAGDLDLMNIDRVVFITPEALDSNGKSVSYFAGLSAQGDCDLVYSGPQGQRSFGHSYIFASPDYHGIDLNRMFGPGVFDGETDEYKASLIKQATTHQMQIDMETITHEIGHTFGLGHANAVQRPRSDLPAIVKTTDETLPGANEHIYVAEYGDPFDVMANSNFRWLNVPQLDEMGWIDHGTQLQTVTSNGSFRIYPLDQSNGDLSKLRGIKIPRAIQSPTENTDSFLWVEYRSGSAPYDLDLSGLNRNVDGALVHYTDPEQLQSEPGDPYYTPNATILLNFAPGGNVSWNQKDLTLKGVWKDPHSMVRLEVLQVTPDYMDVQVSFEQ